MRPRPAGTEKRKEPSAAGRGFFFIDFALPPPSGSSLLPDGRLASRICGKEIHQIDGEDDSSRRQNMKEGIGFPKGVEHLQHYIDSHTEWTMARAMGIRK